MEKRILIDVLFLFSLIAFVFTSDYSVSRKNQLMCLGPVTKTVSVVVVAPADNKHFLRGANWGS